MWRVYLIYFLLFVFGIAIIVKVITIQFSEGEQWRQKAEQLTTAYINIEAVRGNIYDANENLLATSVPIYEVRMDMIADGLTEEVFRKNVGALAESLSQLFKDKTSSEYKKELIGARHRGERYHLIARKVSYRELKQLQNFPIFSLGRYKGGFIYVQQNKREHPFRILAARTIGYDREGMKPIGLEGAYNKYLRGVSGKRLMQKITGGVWMPLNDENELDPEDGSDLYSTIDINIQDVAENALMKQLKAHNAHHGCVVLMEVATGEVKAIANLSKNSVGDYYENYNYAIGESTEPGSTFKLASLMAALEDGLINLTDSVDTEKGIYKFFDKTMKDSRDGGYGKITVKNAFEVSSNVGVSKIIYNCYAKKPQEFIDRIRKFGLGQPLGLEIYGESKPEIKNSTDKTWSGVSLPWMSIGYELSMTPLQILTFYNAVANNGKMVKPRFVMEIRDKRNTVKKFKTEILNEMICSKSTLEKAKKMMEGVVENGTAAILKNSPYKIAGKTGTAQIGYGDKTKPVSYQASFVGYFPAENPKYSCIVVVSAPAAGEYYGAKVAAPIFKEVADKVYATSIEIHKNIDELNINSSLVSAPYSKSGTKKDIQKVLKTLNIPIASTSGSDWVLTVAQKNSVDMKSRNFRADIVPNVIGMGVKDAVFLLENMGLKVIVKGKGMVHTQSISEGEKIISGSKILLELS